jgi:intermediate cleaving peptidase 55
MIKYVKPGMGEHEIQAYLEFKCKVRGADTMAYVPVVAGGANALVIHYVVNNAIVNDGELILCDAGAEFGGYCADITRTFPVNGKFSPAQREIYSAVLEANTLAVSRCRAGGMSLDAIHNESVQNLYEAVCDIFERQITLKEMQSFYPHHIAHYLGLDVHDTFSISRDIPLKAGMVVTMEPGLYIPNDKEKYGEYAGIGVRIEDDILITEGEPIVLSAGSPKEINEIEELYPPNE